MALAAAGAGLAIWDLGANSGQDTAYYLALGASVVAVEANPFLAAALRRRFPAALASGRLQLVDRALLPRPAAGPVRLHLFDNDHLGTVVEDWARRNTALLGASATTVVEVPTCTLADLVEGFGTPDVVKLDVEGLDTELLEALAALARRIPALRASLAYLSWETAYQEPRRLPTLRRQLAAAAALGFRRFAISPQRRHREASPGDPRCWPQGLGWRFERGASGPFGDQLDRPWTGPAELLAAYGRLPAVRRGRVYGPAGLVDRALPRRLRPPARRLLRRALGDLDWFDVHARKP